MINIPVKFESEKLDGITLLNTSLFYDQLFVRVEGVLYHPGTTTIITLEQELDAKQYFQTLGLAADIIVKPDSLVKFVAFGYFNKVEIIDNTLCFYN